VYAYRADSRLRKYGISTKKDDLSQKARPLGYRIEERAKEKVMLNEMRKEKSCSIVRRKKKRRR